MKNHVLKIAKDSSGVAAVEFALIAPALLLLLIGMVDYGLYMNSTMKIENVARAAAEYLYEGGNSDSLVADVFLPSNLDLTEDTVDESLSYTANYYCECVDGDVVECDGTCGDEEDDDSYMRRYLEVRLSMNHEPLLYYPGLGRSINLGGFVRLQVE